MYAESLGIQALSELRSWEQRLHCIVLKVSGRHFQGKRAYLSGHRGGVAQLGEHLLCKQGVIGSNPFTSTREKDLGS